MAIVIIGAYQGGQPLRVTGVAILTDSVSVECSAVAILTPSSSTNDGFRPTEKLPGSSPRGYFASKIVGAEDQIRTDTGLPPLDFEFGAKRINGFF